MHFHLHNVWVYMDTINFLDGKVSMILLVSKHLGICIKFTTCEEYC